MIDACDWSHPSADAYMGTPRAAIMAMAEIPHPVRLVLAARAEAHDFDDSIYIDRDTIRSPKHAYDPAIRSMAFGSQGRVCKTVTRAGWPDSWVEGAWVYCDSGWCVAMPAVCRNFFIVTRLPAAPAIRPGNDGSLVAALGDEPTAVTIADPQMPSGPAGLPVGQPVLADGSVGPAFTYAPQFYGPAVGYTPALPVPAVPEPSSGALMIAGLAVGLILAARGAFK